MKSERYIRVSVTTTVGVYLPANSGADRAVTKEKLEKRLLKTGDDRSDGRRPFSVEQLQDAAEKIVANAIKHIVYDYLLPPDGTRGEGQLKRLEIDVAGAMTSVVVRETETDNEHTLVFKIEE